MKRLYIISLLFLLTFFLSANFAFAQDPLKLDLKLKNKTSFPPMPHSGEFNLSLDSQLFDPTLTIGKLTNIELDKPITDREITATSVEVEKSNYPISISEPRQTEPKLQLMTSKQPQERMFSSTLTLTTGYHDNNLNLIDDENEGLRLEKKLGKFKILGEFEQRKIARIPIPADNSKSAFTLNAKENLTRASMIGETGQEGSQQSKTSALASRYFLEAIYSFKPTVQGKLSYKRSMIDAIESEEKLQLEGTVEANRNILIKAGYNNETRPEVNEPKTTKDSKVWTEFILKF